MPKGDKSYYKALRLASQDSYSSKNVIQLLEMSILQGNRKASYALASWYLNGFNVRKNYKKAFNLLQKAVQGGPEKGFDMYKDALLDVAVCYELGNGTDKDPQKAFYYYLLAAKNGDLQALKELSRCFFYGIGVAKDRKISSLIDEYSECKTTS